MVNRNIADKARAYAESDLQEEIAKAVAKNKFEVKVTPPINVDVDALIAYVADYGYIATKSGYDVIIKW